MLTDCTVMPLSTRSLQILKKLGIKSSIFKENSATVHWLQPLTFSIPIIPDLVCRATSRFTDEFQDKVFFGTAGQPWLFNGSTCWQVTVDLSFQLRSFMLTIQHLFIRSVNSKKGILLILNFKVCQLGSWI